MYYFWEWGDGTNSGWIGPYISGKTITVSHSWAARGVYFIRVKAKDVYGYESSWSNTLKVSIT